MANIPFPEMEKLIIQEKLSTELTPHGIPFPSPQSFERFAEEEKRNSLLPRLAKAFAVVLLGAGILAFFYLTNSSLFSTFSPVISMFALGGAIMILMLPAQAGKRKFERAAKAVSAFYEPVLAALPEPPINASISGFDQYGNVEFLNSFAEPDESTSKLSFSLPAYPGVAFSFRYKKVYSGRGNAFFRAFCMYASADSKLRSDARLRLFKGDVMKEGEVSLREISSRLANEPEFQAKPTWLFELPDSTRILGLVTFADDFNSINFSNGKALVRVTVSPQATPEDVSKAVSCLLKIASIMKKAGAV